MKCRTCGRDEAANEREANVDPKKCWRGSNASRALCRLNRYAKHDQRFRALRGIVAELRRPGISAQERNRLVNDLIGAVETL